MNYLKYYNILRLHLLTKKGLGFMFVFIILYIIQTDVFFTDTNEFELGYSFIILISLYVISMYAYQIRFNPTHPIYQFPISSKQRVKYDYIGVFFSFISLTVILTLFGISVVGLFVLFGTNIEGNPVDDTFTIFGTMYQTAYLFIIISIVMPLSYISSNKYRYLIGITSFIILGLVNFMVIWILSGELFISGDIKIMIDKASYGYIVAIGFFVFSILAIYQSYKISSNLNKY